MKRLSLPIVWMVMAGLLFCACESGSGREGRYLSSESEGARVTLTLESDGKGLWMTDQESMPVRWKMRQGAMWLHVKTGGVLIAQPLDDDKSLSVSLPGGVTILLKKTTN
jgi:hypothetical protein